MPTLVKVYMAASIPRSMRTARLSYLPLDTIIGSWSIDSNPRQFFDVIMLPEPDFLRAKLRLGISTLANPTLNLVGFNAGYVPQDTRRVAIPDNVKNPYEYAANKLQQLFNLDIHRTIYPDHPSVEATVTTRDMNLTSWTRKISAPKNADIATTAAVPSSRSSTDVSKT